MANTIDDLRISLAQLKERLEKSKEEAEELQLRIDGVEVAIGILEDEEQNNE